MDRLRAIAAFAQIARSGSLSRAAEELGVSRALVSAQLKQLEQHLGVRLINRTTRRLALTAAGAEYLAFCERTLESFETEEARISQLQSEPQGTLKIMASMAFGHTQIASIATAFTTRHPGVRISLILSDRAFSLSDFVEGGYDLGVSMHVLKDAAIVSSKLAEGDWLACASPAYIAGHARISRPGDLADHNCLIHRSHAPDGVWRFFSASRSYAVAVSGALFTNSSMVLREAVLAGSGVAMMPAYAVGEDLKTGVLSQILTGYSSERRPIYVVYPHLRYMPKRTRLFIDALRRSLRGRAL